MRHDRRGYGEDVTAPNENRQRPAGNPPARPLREWLLDAAYGLATSRGWDDTRMADVGAAAGVSRQTVYNEFGSKAGLGQALVLRETERFLVGIQQQLDAEPVRIGPAVRAAVEFTLAEAADNPLLKAVLTSARGDDGLLPLLTTRSEPVLQAAGTALRAHLSLRHPELDRNLAPGTADLAVDTLVRLVVSHLVLPLASPETTAAALATVFTRLLGLPPEADPPTS